MINRAVVPAVENEGGPLIGAEAGGLRGRILHLSDLIQLICQLQHLLLHRIAVGFRAASPRKARLNPDNVVPWRTWRQFRVTYREAAPDYSRMQPHLCIANMTTCDSVLIRCSL